MFPVIQVTKEEKEWLRRPWRRSLIIRVLGRTVDYSYLLQRLQHMWKPESTFELFALAHDYYIAKFQSLADYDSAKFGGPWIILGHYLVVQEWEPNFIPSKNKTKKLLVWVRFPELPIEYFDEEFLKKIGKTIGRPVKIDTTTSLASIGKFARICVEIDITKPLLSKFVLHFMDWPIEYEGINLICFKCERRGRTKNNVQPGAREAGAGGQAATNNAPAFEGLGDHSRFSTLNGLDENMQEVNEQDMGLEFQQPVTALPRIRTNHRNPQRQSEQNFRGPELRATEHIIT
ncbi:PREDICTED: uncharacterized protein LOC109189684 [Ipomoea nil]|uniref:uncharacterized protein LOC109189684 n=1 Tax=Ipomoea nil TaxID=35883 RepID=UPI000900EBB5|nr:PREDICTED: uncharacterized protein LOC109189684 [Ipomoea nil]